MSIHVYRKQQSPRADSPAHRSPRWLASAIVAAFIARWLDSRERELQLLTDESWASIKQRFKGPASSQSFPIITTSCPTPSPCSTTSSRRLIHRLYPPGPPANLVLAYPVQDQTSYARRTRQEIWGGSVEQFAARVGSGGVGAA